MKTILRWLALAAGAAALGIAALWGTGHLDLTTFASFDKGRTGAATARVLDQPPSVTVVRPERRTFVERLRLTGSLVAREEVLITPQIEGQRVSELLVDAGAYVEKGQLLARLATENLDAQIAQNDAAMARAEAGIAQARSAITQADASAREASASFERAKPLRKSGYLSQSIFDQRQASATSARAALAIANDRLDAATSEKAQAMAQRRELLWRRSRTDMHSPVAGLILTRATKVGAIATAIGEAMFRIVVGGELELEGTVTASQLERLRPGQTAMVEVGGRAVQGRTRLVYPRVEPATRLGAVRIFLGRNDALRVGAFATARIETTESTGLGIPANAVMRDPAGPYVLVVDAGRTAIRRLTLGLVDGDAVEVREGLSDGDRVIAKAGTFLGPGEAVTPIETEPAARTADRPKAG